MGAAEISRAQWGNETQGPEDVLVVLLRKTVVLVPMQKKGFFGASQRNPRSVALADYSDVAEDDDIFGHSVLFPARDEDDHFLLSWQDPAECRRMFMAIFDAHRGRYSRWGVQLDPDNYGADFDRYYAQLIAECPDAGGGMDVFNWAEQEFGEFDVSNALGLAVDWRACELDDAAGREPSRRIGRLGFPEPWISNGAAAERVFLRRESSCLTPVCSIPLSTSAPSTRESRLPRTSRLRPGTLDSADAPRDPRQAVRPPSRPNLDRQREGRVSISATRALLQGFLRERWTAIGDLPAVDESPPAEIPIQEDVDVRAISSHEDDRVVYSQDGLTEADDELIKAFFMADQELARNDGEAVVAACLLGVKAFEGLSPEAPPGWRKLILYAVSDLTYDVWKKYKLGDPAARLAHWVVATIEANGWGPDGRATPLGQHHSYAMGVAVDSGVGAILIDPKTGVAHAPTGEEARQAAAVGHF